MVPDVGRLRRAFDYLVPGPLDARVRVGTQVRVPLAGRRVAGWVVADHVVPPEGVALRALAAVRGWGPPPEVLELCAWAAWRWAGPLPAFLGTASAPHVVSALPAPPGSPIIPPLLPSVVSGVEQSDETARAEREEMTLVANDALAGGVRVVRLAPCLDPFPIVLAAVSRLTGAFYPDAALGEGPPGVLILAPSQHAAGKVASRLRAAGVPVAVLPGEWQMARAGGCVAVGSRAAAFAPLPGLSGVVVLDAHDEAYHEERAPTWSAWAVVAERARRAGAPCALVSPCPTLELLGAGPLVTTSRLLERRGWPAVEVLDRREDDPRTGLFSPRVVQVVRWAHEAPDRRVLCVLNRTGRIRLLGCSSCGEIARCEVCTGALETAEEGVLSCRLCGQQRPVLCASCGSIRLKALRSGTTRVREELEALVGATVAEVTGQEQSSESTAVMVGTEALLHRVAHGNVVVFLDFDAELLAARFAAGEQALGLLARAARVVTGDGPGAPRGPGRLVIQTRQPSHPVLLSAVGADPGRLAAEEAELRRILALPPESAMAKISGVVAEQYVEDLRAAAPPGVEIGGSAEHGWSVKAPDHRVLCDLLATVRRPPGRLRVEVDPVRG